MRGVVVLTYDANGTGWRQRFWLTRDYLPEFAGVLTGLPALAYWRRPEAYLDEHVRRAISVWTRVGLEAEQRAVGDLRDDLASGRFAAKLAQLRAGEREACLSSCAGVREPQRPRGSGWSGRPPSVQRVVPGPPAIKAVGPASP
jgi:hypothetical protein